MSILKFEIDLEHDTKIDSKLGIIKGVSVISTPEAKGHNIKIDQKSIQSFLEAVEGEKVKAYYTHSPENDALDAIGLWENFQIVEDGEFTKLTADFLALESWKEHHKDEYDALFEMAEKAPEAFGVSAEFTIEKIYYNDEGEEEKYEGQEDKEVYARAVEVSAFSIVAQPAANPTGLFAEAKEEIEEEQDNLVVLTKKLIDMDREKNDVVVELKSAQTALEKFSERIANQEKEIAELKEENKEWQARYAKVITDSGADPVSANAQEAPKSFEEQLANCQTWREKHNLIQANMTKLVTTWNQ